MVLRNPISVVCFVTENCAAYPLLFNPFRKGIKQAILILDLLGKEDTFGVGEGKKRWQQMDISSRVAFVGGKKGMQGRYLTCKWVVVI